jgi:CubicO group peptidase (beta-lactamase class C family)
MKKHILTLLLLAFAFRVEARDAADCGAPAALDDGWSVATPAEAGFDPARLCALDALLETWPTRNIHSVVVARRGRLVMERYFKGPDERWGQSLGTVQYAPEVLHDVRSVSKSVTSLLVGIALAEGKFPPLDSPVLASFPELAHLRTPEKDRITFRHLLTMSVGWQWEEDRPFTDPLNNEMAMILSPDPFRYILSQPMKTPPGTLYAYSGGATSLLGETLVRGTGQALRDYARDKLFGPLDVAEFQWDDVGVSRKLGAFGSLRLRPRDMAKLGHLMLTDGKWKARRVLPSGWAAESVVPRTVGNGAYFYGYQWWLGRSLVDGRQVDYAAAFGLGGQRVFIVPSRDLVVVTTAGHYTGALQSTLPGAVLNALVLPAVKD